MTSPPQPRRSGALVDSSDPNLNNAAGLSSGTRKAANERQRRLAAEQVEYERWRSAMIQQIWGKQ